MQQKQIKLIVHNVRSCQNVGSLLRTAEGLGLEEVILSGYTPYPAHIDDARLPHIAKAVDRRIHTSALGAESLVRWRYEESWDTVAHTLRTAGFALVALEQAAGAELLPGYRCPKKIALVVGREVEGLESYVLQQADEIVSIPMLGSKESYNVCQAAAMALYHCRFS